MSTTETITEEDVAKLVDLIPAGEEPLAEEVRVHAAALPGLLARSRALRAQVDPDPGEVEALLSEMVAHEERTARLQAAVRRVAAGAVGHRH